MFQSYIAFTLAIFAAHATGFSSRLSHLKYFSYNSLLQKRNSLFHAYTSEGCSTTKLYSFGDPDNSAESVMQRNMQEIFRKIDNKIIFKDDPDVPGLTFTTPVEWAPWMETIWFGNSYDYRTAYFHDVMYSNNVPSREGALLFKNVQQASQIALIYQRYKKFDQSSYSLSNATFFNIFGAESLRVGRYKVPLSDEIIVCVTDPLTFSEMRRYLNSLNPLKWFKSKFFQQKRKRQILMNLRPDTPDFFAKVVHFIEYGRMVDKLGSSEKEVRIPIVPVDRPNITDDSSGIVVDMNTANAQYFLESLFQSVLNQMAKSKRLSQCQILIGGDERILNNFATETFVRIAAGNKVANVIIAQNNSLTISDANDFMAKSPSIDLSIVLTALSEDEGMKGDFGLVPIMQNTAPQSNDFLTGVQDTMTGLNEVSIIPQRAAKLSSLLQFNTFVYGSTKVSSQVVAK